MEFKELLNDYYDGNISIGELEKQIACSYIQSVGKNIA